MTKGPSPEPQHRKAKIVCTLGPASDTEAVLRDMMRLGMDVARLNFSHGTYEDHARIIERVREVADSEGRTICILQDLQGPKIRTGRLKYRTPVALKAGSTLTITPRDIAGNATLVSTTFKSLAQEVEPGARVLLSDGLIELRVRAIHGEDVECTVVNGGLLGEHKGINLPGTVVRVPALTEKDEKDVEFGVKHGVEMIAASFVRTADDVRQAKRLIAGHKSDAWVIAKLEKPQAIEHLEEILDVADGVMVARGDLGVEVAPEKVPMIQKHVIRRSADWRKPVITATQMLESMVENPRPTRAEASDVANAIFDGSDAVMLSAETASGKYPREAVAMMDKIIQEAELHPDDALLRRRHRRTLSISETVCESVAHAAQDLDMRAIAVYTESGTTARLISKYRPRCPIHALAASARVCARLNLLWGVSPALSEVESQTEDMVAKAEALLRTREAVRQGDIIAIVAGTHSSSGSTNFMRLHEVGAAAAPRPSSSHDRRKATRSKPIPERRKR
ncbi:MAG TPA: pyruvate kinase [Candidatus Angelobacter sp.]